jgi:hypothetical protein
VRKSKGGNIETCLLYNQASYYLQWLLTNRRERINDWAKAMHCHCTMTTARRSATVALCLLAMTETSLAMPSTLRNIVAPWTSSSWQAQRNLKGTKEWSQCTTLELSPSECQELIEKYIGESNTSNLNVVVVTEGIPAENENLPASIMTTQSSPYYEVPISTNLYGEVSCDVHHVDGVGSDDVQVKYAFQWDPLVNQSFTAPPVSCAGLSAVDCCHLLKSAIPDMDFKGNFLTCRFHQAPLTVSANNDDNSDNNDARYVNHVYDKDKKECVAQEITHEQVQDTDQATRIAMVEDVHVIVSDVVAEGAASCLQLSKLSDKLMLDSRGMSGTGIQETIQQLVCRGEETLAEDYNDRQPHEVTTEQTHLLRDIQHFFIDKKEFVDSRQTYVVIYASADGRHVLAPPSIGVIDPPQASAATVVTALEPLDIGEEDEHEISSSNDEGLPEHGNSEELCLIDPYAMDALAMLDPADDACADSPTAKVLSSEYKNLLGYSVTLQKRVLTSSTSGPEPLILDGKTYELELDLDLVDQNGDDDASIRTQFHYEVCRDAHAAFVLKAEAFSLTWLGECSITGYSYVDGSDLTQLEGAEGDGEVEFGLDPRTCTSGVHYRLIQQHGDLCQNIMLEVQGNVPATPNEKDGVTASISLHGNYFASFAVRGPDCSFCIVSD